jgi:hypothetical protein
VSDDYENILNDLMPGDLGISSMHLSGKLFQMIDNKNKTMIVEMKAPSVILSPCFVFYIILLVFLRKNIYMLKLK